MKRSKFTEAQIAFALRQSKTGTRVEEICRQMGVSQATFFNWKKKYGGLGVPELRKLRQLEEENAQLKKLVADLSFDKQMLQDVIKKVVKPAYKKKWPIGWLAIIGYQPNGPVDVYALPGRCTNISITDIGKIVC
ncbi:transposase [Sphingobacterium detergens]